MSICQPHLGRSLAIFFFNLENRVSEKGPGLEFSVSNDLGVILQPPLPKGRTDYKRAPLCLVSGVLGMEPRVLCLQGKPSAN